MICSFVILGENLLNGWCRMTMRSFATDVICLFVHYYVVKVQDYIELEIKLKLKSVISKSRAFQ